MKQIIALSIALSLILAVSCKKKKTEDTSPSSPGTTSSNTTSQYFMPLKIGNYWIYNRYSVDPSGTETFVTSDSLYISKDTVIAGKVYYIIEGSTMGTGVLQRPVLTQIDSDILFADGKYYYKHNDFTTILSNDYGIGSTATDTIYHSIEKMADHQMNITVPAGTFTTDNHQKSIKVWPAYKQCCDSLFQNAYFSENIGVVKETVLMFVSGAHTDRKLIRYHLN